MSWKEFLHLRASRCKLAQTANVTLEDKQALGVTTESSVTSTDKGGRRKRLPAWLYWPGVMRGTFRLAWTNGIGLLVHAAESGAALRRQVLTHSPDGVPSHQTFDERLASLPIRLELNVRAYPEKSDLVAAMIGVLRVEASKFKWDRNPLTPSNLVHQLALLPKTKWWEGVKDPANLDSPVTLLRTAYAAFQALSGRLGLPGQGLLMALALIGIAERGLRKMHRCGICFRWAIPGQTHCHEHSQSTAADGPLRERDARRQQAARLKRRTPKLRNSFGLAPRIAPSRVAIVVGRVLWNLRAPNERKMRAAIQREIKASAPLRALIGQSADYSDHKMVSRLRAQIDPFEFDSSAWIPTLHAANAWLKAQAAATGHRGVGIKSRLVMLQACHLAEIGMSRQEVARALDRTPTAIGQWLIRYAEPSHPLHDLAQRLGVALAAPRHGQRQFADRALHRTLGRVQRPGRRG
jgi:hypothetical protein